MGLAPALLEEISYDENGNIQGGCFMDYLVPTSMETPSRETGKTVTPSPHHPFGAKGVGESATVGAPPAIGNAVVDTLAPSRRPSHRHFHHTREGLEHPQGEGRRRVGAGSPYDELPPRADRVREDRSTRWSSSRSDCRSAYSGRS
jgi:hypothetical protein